jgi:hypothetical protein
LQPLIQPVLDLLPEGPAPLCEPSPPIQNMDTSLNNPRTISTTMSSSDSFVGLRIQRTTSTATNTFGLYREYPDIPGKVPDEQADVTDLTEINKHSSEQDLDENASAELGLFPNTSTLNFLQWFWNCGSLKSIGDRDRLVKEVFHSPEGFNVQDIQVGQLHKLDAQMSGQNRMHLSLSPDSDGWIERTVQVPIPDGIPHPRGAEDAPMLSVPHFYHRKLTKVIKKAFTAPTAKRFHFTPYKQFWKPPSDPNTLPQRVVDEMYTSDSFLAAHEEIQLLSPEPNCNLPRAVAGMMFASDGLKLTNFGDASLWPGYVYFANQSKWERTKPRARAAHHIAYFPKVRVIHNK